MKSNRSAFVKPINFVMALTCFDFFTKTTALQAKKVLLETVTNDLHCEN